MAFPTALLQHLARLASDDATVTLADLAAADGRSPAHLQRIFKHAVGESPKQYQRRIRLQRSAAVLLVTERSVLDIALDAGFDSHEGFTRAFHAFFGVSPTEFRKRRDTYHQHVAEHRRHLDVVQHTAACVRLFQLSLAEKPAITPPKGSSMPYSIRLESASPTPFLFMRRQVPLADKEQIAAVLGECLGAVFQYGTQSGITFAGPPVVRYTEMGPGLTTLESGLPVVGQPSPGEGMELGELPGGEHAVTLHQGAYDQLNEAHSAVQTWMAAENRKASGGPWDVYITDPGEFPDPKDWQTAVVWPLAPK